MKSLYNLVKNYYPAFIIAATALVIYGPYLLGKIPVSLGALTKYSVFNHLLSANDGLINFHKHMGEFVGGDYHYGFFDPIYHLLINFGPGNAYATEAILTVFFFIISFGATYYFLRQNDINVWAAIFSASLFIMSGFHFKDDQSTSLGLSNLVFLPLLFLLIQRNLTTWLEKISFIFLIWLESTYSNPQLVFWQIIIIGIFIIIYQRQLLKKYIILLAIAGLLMMPQFLLTASLFSFDAESRGHQVFDAELGLIHIAQIFFPLSSLPPHPQDYITPFFYTNILGTILFVLSLPLIFLKRRELPKPIIFFCVVAIISFIATIKGNPIQFILGQTPFINTFLTRNPFRYLHFYFFSLSFIVGYALSSLMFKKDLIIRISHRLMVLGSIVTGGFLLATIVFITWGDTLYSRVENYVLNSGLISGSGNYPIDYYKNYLNTLWERQFTNYTLLTLNGWITFLPFLFFVLWGVFVFKKPSLVEKYWPKFILLSILPTALMFNLIFWQLTTENGKINPGRLTSIIETREANQNYYVLPYGINSGESFIKNIYLKDDDIQFWLTSNYFSCNDTTYGPLPSLQSQTNPFHPIGPLSITNYIGYTCVQNNLGLNGPFVKLDKVDKHLIEKNLADRIGFIKTLGVRYIVSNFSFSNSNDLTLIATEKYPRPSDLLTNTSAVLYLYEIKNPNEIIFVPQKIIVTNQLIDWQNTSSVIKIFDQINYKDTSTISIPNWPTEESINQICPPIIELIKKDEQGISFKSDLCTESYVVINVNYYPGWEAFTDNEATDIYRANLNFISIKIPPGQKTTTLRFNPTKMIIGSLFSDR